MRRKSFKIGELLVNAGLIDQFQLNSGLSHQRYWGGRLGASLVKLGYIEEEALLSFLAQQLHLPRVDLAKRKISPDLLAYVSAEKAREYNVIPVERKERSGTLNLLMAMSDPGNLRAIDDLQFITGCRVFPALVSEAAIKQAIEHYYGLPLALEERDPLAAPAAAAGPAEPLQSELPLSALAGGGMVSEERFLQLLKVLLEKGVLTLREFDRLK